MKTSELEKMIKDIKYVFSGSNMNDAEKHIIAKSMAKHFNVTKSYVLKKIEKEHNND